MRPIILPAHDCAASYRQGRLPATLTADRITAVLGVEPSADFDEDKVSCQWDFTVDGQRCAIWDYRGQRWSTFGPQELLGAVFGEASL